LVTKVGTSTFVTNDPLAHVDHRPASVEVSASEPGFAALDRSSCQTAAALGARWKALVNGQLARVHLYHIGGRCLVPIFGHPTDRHETLSGRPGKRMGKKETCFVSLATKRWRSALTASFRASWRHLLAPANQDIRSFPQHVV